MSECCVPRGYQIIPIVAQEVEYKVADPKSEYSPNPPRVWSVGESKERPPENHYSKHRLSLNWDGRAIIDEVLGKKAGLISKDQLAGSLRGADDHAPAFVAR